jgi:peptide/nickel transport system substrate-binding protein
VTLPIGRPARAERTRPVRAEHGSGAVFAASHHAASQAAARTEFRMKRRQLLGRSAAFLATAGLARPSLVRAASATTLKFVPYADLALLDPQVSAFVTRNHVMMVFDTLFALDAAGNAQPQMLAGYVVEDGEKTWKLTLRDGLKFHDDTPVLARDVVASLQRWAIRDPFAQALMDATDELSAPSDKLVQFRLKRPFPLLPQALGKPTNLMAAIMPERLTQTPPGTLTEMIGSGPFRFIANERVPGARNVYAKFEGYVPREGAPSFCAGARIARFDRVEWLTTPDPATQAAALQAGEVDWVEQPVMDLVPSLKRDSNLKVEVVETTGLIGVLRFNQLFAPFDNPAIRRAALKAVNQREFMEAVAGEADPGVIDDHVGFFAPSSPYASDAGMEMMKGKHDLAALKQEVMAAGYKGEKVVFLGAADVPRISAICQVGADMLSKIGLNVDYVSTDWGTVVQRITRKQPIDQGGWSIFGSMWGGYDWYSPAGDAALRGNGADAWFGWPTAPKLEALRDQWLHAPDMASQKAIAREIQMQALQDVPCLPVGLYYQPVAYRNDLTDMLKGLILFTNVRRT